MVRCSWYIGSSTLFAWKLLEGIGCLLLFCKWFIVELSIFFFSLSSGDVGSFALQWKKILVSMLPLMGVENWCCLHPIPVFDGFLWSWLFLNDEVPLLSSFWCLAFGVCFFFSCRSQLSLFIVVWTHFCFDQYLFLASGSRKFVCNLLLYAHSGILFCLIPTTTLSLQTGF